jgi:hypothetical protein
MTACRFMPVLRTLGIATVYSHTVRVKVDYRDPDQLRAAVEAMGGAWIGQGTHQLFAGQSATGHGFTLPGWNFPLVLDSAGELHFDDFSGSWGDTKHLEQLKTEYAFVKTEREAQLLGWQTERTDNGLLVYHPDGGLLTVSREMVCETTGFVGTGCHDARLALGLAADGSPVNKVEHDQAAARIQLPTA